MAAALAFPNSQQQPQGSTFSPLTMFECTISSATMLIDNMAVRDLLVAFKIVAQLHGHLLEVLDPTVQRLANIADEHSMCPPPSSQPSYSAAPGTSKLDDKSESFPVKPEALDSDDDCVLMEADLIFDNSSMSFGQSPAKAGAQRPVSDMSETGELSNEWKGMLRKAYRVLKDETGTNVFDFSLPYSARVNVQAANRVIDKALALSRQRPANPDAWRKTGYRYLGVYYASTLKPAVKAEQQATRCRRVFHYHSRLTAKLNRRQKSYETMKAGLDGPTRAKFESVLTRDYTSSDEEAGADLDSEMKVRSLPWESDELRAMKRQLDDVYASQLADDKQRAEVARLQRDPSVLSGRLPPADCVDWAKSPNWAPPAQPDASG